MGVDPDYTDKKGNTALHYAIKMGRVSVVKVLVLNGADIEIENNAGQTAEDLADDLDNETISNIISNDKN